MKKTLQDDARSLKMFTFGKGEPVVVLHGQLSTHGYMRELVNRVAKQRRVYSPDLLGFGDSPRPRHASYSVQQHVDSLHKTVQEAGVNTPFVLFGHSMGAQLALAFAQKYPEFVSALVLTSLPLFESPDTAYDQMAAADPRIAWILRGKRARLLRMLPRFAEKPLGWYSTWVNKGVYPAYISREAVRHNWQGYHRSMENVVVRYSPFEAIKSVNVPLHFIFGDTDTLNPGAETKLHPSLRKNQTIEILVGGHQIPIEHTDIVAQRILQV